MFAYECKALLFLLIVNLLQQISYADTEDSKDDAGNDKPADRIMMTAFSLSPQQYSELLVSEQLASLPPAEGLLGAAPVNSLLAAYLQSKDAKRTASSRADIDHYVHMLMDGLLEEWRPFHPHTDAEALQMVRDFIASRDVSSDLAKLKPQHANHEEWRERLKYLLFHYVKQPYVKQHPGLQRAMKWYLNRLKHTIWVRRRLARRRIAITRMNLLFSYLQSLDKAVDQKKYRFDIYKETGRTAALKKRLVKLFSSPEVTTNAELTAAFKHYIRKLTEALEETKKHKSTIQLSEIPIQNIPLAATQQEIFPKKITTYIDIVQDFIERKKKLEDTKNILDGQSIDSVGGIRNILEHYLKSTEVTGNATLTEAIDTFLSKLKHLPSHHLLDKHLKQETMQKTVRKYEVVYEYLSKLEWKRSGSPEEVLQQALENPEIQKNTTLMDAISFYLENSPKEQEEVDEEDEEEAVNEEQKEVEERLMEGEIHVISEGQAVPDEQKEVEEEKAVEGEAQVINEEQAVYRVQKEVEEEKAVEGEAQVINEKQAVYEDKKEVEEEKAVEGEAQVMNDKQAVYEDKKEVEEEKAVEGEGQIINEEQAVHRVQKEVEEEKAVGGEAQVIHKEQAGYRVQKEVEEEKAVEGEEQAVNEGQPVYEEQKEVEEEKAVEGVVQVVNEDQAVHEGQKEVGEEKAIEGEAQIENIEQAIHEEQKEAEEEQQQVVEEEEEPEAIRKGRDAPIRELKPSNITAGDGRRKLIPFSQQNALALLSTTHRDQNEARKFRQQGKV